MLEQFRYSCVRNVLNACNVLDNYFVGMSMQHFMLLRDINPIVLKLLSSRIPQFTWHFMCDLSRGSTGAGNGGNRRHG